MADVPESEWVWCGVAGHFIAASSCRFHLNTRVGDYRISTVGAYVPDRAKGKDDWEDIGYGRKFETFVFPVAGHGEHGEGEVAEWSEIDSEGCNDIVEAEAMHMTMCRKWAAK